MLEEDGARVTTIPRKLAKISSKSKGISECNGESQMTQTNSNMSKALVVEEPSNKKICLKHKQGGSDHDHAKNSRDRLTEQSKVSQEALLPTTTSAAITTAQKPRNESTEASSNLVVLNASQSTLSKECAYIKELSDSLPRTKTNFAQKSLPQKNEEKSTKQTVTCALCEEMLLKEELSGHISKDHGNLSLDEYHTFARTQQDNVQDTLNVAQSCQTIITNNVTKKKESPSTISTRVISCTPLSASEVLDFETDSSSDEEDNKPQGNVKVESQPSQKRATDDPDLKVAQALKEYLGLSDQTPFLQKSKDEQAEIGQHLEHVLRVLCDSALVPLMMSTLTKRDITKIAALSDLFEAGVTIKDEGEDNDEVMARADADLANIGSDGVTNSCDDSSPSDDEKIISSEESD